MDSLIELTFKVNDLLIATQISVTPCNEGQSINYFQDSHMWPKFINALKRVFSEKDWLDLSCSFNGDFFLSPNVHIKYKRTSKIVKKVIRNTLECTVENIKGSDYSWLIEEVSSDQPQKGSSNNISKEASSSSTRINHVKHCKKRRHSSGDVKNDFYYHKEKTARYSNAGIQAKVPTKKNTAPLIEVLDGYEVGEVFTYDTDSDSDQLSVESLLDTSYEMSDK